MNEQKGENLTKNRKKFPVLDLFQNNYVLKSSQKRLTSRFHVEIFWGFQKGIIYTIYSSRKWMLVVFCFMKQNCYILRGVAECRHAATPLSSYSINNTHQGFQKRYITLLYLKGLKSYQPSKFKCLHLVNQTFHLHFCW